MTTRHNRFVPRRSTATRSATTRPVATRSVAAVVAGLALGLGLLAGCSSEGAETQCSLDECTVTFDRGVDARANILGVEAKLVDAQDERVTLEVAGERVSLTTGQAATEVGGLRVSLQSVDDANVVVQIAR